jgi:hypothetical protein
LLGGPGQADLREEFETNFTGCRKVGFEYALVSFFYLN